MPSPLDSIIAAIRADRGLSANVPAADIGEGVSAARDMNRVLLAMLNQTNGNDDGRITGADLQAVSDILWEPQNAQPWRDFYIGHGNDNGDVESGYHAVQDDGGTLVFQGRNFLDTVADAIYHYGFRIEGGNYFNEDGNTNQSIADVAGWLNFFLNGENSVYGTGGADELGSGEYSNYFAAARNETFLAGNGNDSIWADVGNDRIYGGQGHDRSGGGTGDDRMWGEMGSDTLYGEDGRDQIFGGAGRDQIGGGSDGDRIEGGSDHDTIWGQEGFDRLFGGDGADRVEGGDERDTLFGGAGNDELSGGDGGDMLFGDDGSDKLSGNEGADHLRGGKGVDVYQLWEMTQSRDRIVFALGDSGREEGRIDLVEGFHVGTDKIDLIAFGEMRFARLDFAGGGKASCYFDGDFLRIDADGNRSTDMMIEIRYVDELSAGDFIFA